MYMKPVIISILLLEACLGRTLTSNKTINILHENQLITVNDRLDFDKDDSSFKCGYSKEGGFDFTIFVDEGQAGSREFPWMVLIKRQEIDRDNKTFSVYQCGGSLITPQIVLTAAHCVNTRKPEEIEVRVGEWDIREEVELYAHQERQVDEIIVHEHYNKGNLFNDIALLFLKTSFDNAPNINTICLPTSAENFDTSRCLATGWGKYENLPNTQYQNTLKKIELPVVPNAKCQENLRNTRLGKRFELHSSLMCAGGEHGKDTCRGDGGSPLVCPMAKDPNRYFQAGIVAWGIGCGTQNVPGVYASVTKLRSWIDRVLRSKKIDSKYFTP